MTISAPARTRASTSSKVAGRFRFRDVDHVVGHDLIIALFRQARFGVYWRTA